MNTLIINRFSLLLFAVIALSTITSCDKDDDHDYDGYGHLHINFSNRYGLSETLGTNAIQTGSNGRDFRINNVQYFVSNVRLVGHSGEEVPFADTYLLTTTFGTNEIELSEVPAGHYTELRFDIGLDSVTNHTDPSLLDNSSPMSLTQAANMHWSWNSGYIFFKIEGLVDTLDSPNGTVDAPWGFHIGMDSYLTTISLPINEEVNEENHSGINVYLNTAALFANIDLGGTDISTHTMGNMGLATKVKNNYSTAFTAE